MAINYEDLIKAEVFDKEWTPQDTVLSAVARKRHGISKAGDKKKGAVLIALKAMYRKGVLKKEVDEDGGVFWGRRTPGDEPVVLRKRAVVQTDPYDLMKLATARKNIKLLEDVLKKTFSVIFEKNYGKDWENHVNERTFEILKTQYWKLNRKNWQPGGTPEELFAGAGIGDFVYIMKDKNNRELFESIFPKVFIISGKLAELADYRNRIQHNEALSKDEYLHFNITAQLFVQKLAE